jgi:hypothetical protein
MIQLVLYHHNCLLTNLQHAKQTARAYTRFRAYTLFRAKQTACAYTLFRAKQTARAYTLFRAKQAALAAIQLDVFEDVRS